MIGIRNPGTSDEQVWINVAERRASFSPSIDREYQIRYYSGDPADPDAIERCEGGWANVNFGNFNVVDNFDCNYNLLFEPTPPP